MFQSVFNQLCKKLERLLRDGLKDAKRLIGLARGQALSFGSPVDSGTQPGSHVDLGTFLEALHGLLTDPQRVFCSWTSEIELTAIAATRYEKSFTYKAFGGGKGHRDLKYTGIGVFFPTGRHSKKKMRHYQKGLGTEPPWAKMINAYIAFQPKDSTVYSDPDAAETPAVAKPKAGSG